MARLDESTANLLLTLVLGFCGGLFGNFFAALLSRAGKRDELAYKHKLDMIAKRQELLLQHRLVMEREAKDSEIVTIRSEVALMS